MKKPAKKEQQGGQPNIKLRPAAAIVPSQNIPGRALAMVVAIMTFLACITAAGVLAVRAAADGWQSDIARELTIQIRPDGAGDLDARTQAAASAAREVAGVRAVRIMSMDEIGSLLAPWLGADAELDSLPVPRLVVVEIDPSAPPDINRLRDVVTERVPTASLDDHKLWQSRLRIMARTLTGAGILVLALVLAALVMSVVFATRGAMAGNKDIVEVLHLVGAKERFIAHQFTMHFLGVGLRGGLAGGIASILFFLLAAWGSGQFMATPAGDQLEALFGTFSVGWPAYAVIAGIVALVAALTALTSRLAVYRFLEVFG